MGRVVGDWELVETIGQGGMGIVFRARHRLIEGEFAIKMLRPELARDASVVRRFLAEVQKARLLDHPNIVRMEIPFRHDEAIYLPMELLRGRTLAELLHNEPGAWPIDRTIDHIHQAASGLGHAHSRSVLHRDVKPENLFVTNTGRVKLLDFGLAKRFGDHTLTQRGMAVGTPVYMAPEVLRGERPCPQSDIYSLGVILYRLLTGQLPIPVQDTAATLAELFGPVLHAHDKGLPRVTAIQPNVPEWLDALTARLLNQNPEERPATGLELARILEHHPTRSDGTSTWDVPRVAAQPDNPVHFLTPIEVEATPPRGPGATPLAAAAAAASDPAAMAGGHGSGDIRPMASPALQPAMPVQFSPRPAASISAPPGAVGTNGHATGIAPAPAHTWAPPPGSVETSKPGQARWKRNPAFAAAAAFALAVVAGTFVYLAANAGSGGEALKTPPSATAENHADTILVSFSSDPEGAFVTVDGRVVCERTPCSGAVGLGHRYVNMRLARYQPYDRVVQINEGQRGVHAKLDPSFAWLTVGTNPPGVRVFVDGQDWGETPTDEREVTPGRHQIEIQDKRYKKKFGEVIVQPGNHGRIELEAIPVRPAAAGAAAAAEGPLETEPDFDERVFNLQP